MIKITNGQMTLTVPNSAFQSFYRHSGFQPIEDENVVSTPEDSFTTAEVETPEEELLDEETEEYEEPDEEEEEEIDLSEIPLSEMDFYQLEAYADQLGLKHTGMRSKKELRALIKQHL